MSKPLLCNPDSVAVNALGNPNLHKIGMLQNKSSHVFFFFSEDAAKQKAEVCLQMLQDDEILEIGSVIRRSVVFMLLTDWQFCKKKKKLQCFITVSPHMPLCLSCISLCFCKCVSVVCAGSP